MALEISNRLFQHAAARRRLVMDAITSTNSDLVSTRSRPKAAGLRGDQVVIVFRVSTRSRPKAAGAHS